SSLGSGVQSWGSSGNVFAIAPLPGGALIAGGSFTTAGGQPASNIAHWNGTAWSPLGAGINGSVRTIHVLPNGDVIAAGEFTQAGGGPAHVITRWNGSGRPPVRAGLAVSSPGVCSMRAAAGGHPALDATLAVTATTSLLLTVGSC